MKKKLALLLAGCLLFTAFSSGTAYAEEQSAVMPDIYFDHCSISPVLNKTGPDGYPYNSLINDLFYIEYPGSWSFGTDDACPIVFFDDSNQQVTTHDFQTFEDSSLIGSEEDIDQYIKGGGINRYLNQVLGITDLSGFTFVIQNKSESILVYSLKKDGKTVASIIVWTIFGKLDIRDERAEVSFNPANDTGDIMVFPVWDSQDFSSIEAIQAFVSSGNLNAYMDPCEGPVTWTSIKAYETEHHQYLLCEGSSDAIKTAVYIPVVPSGMKKWIVGFDSYKESQNPMNAYQIREEIIQSFKVLK